MAGGDGILRIQDIREAGHCVRGAKTWFEARGFDYRKFLREGIDEQTLLDTGDALAEEIIRKKHARHG